MKRLLIILLIIANTIGFIVLGAIYFFAFDLQWGITWQALTIGIPLLAGMVFLIIDSISMIRNKSLKRGWRGFGLGLAAFFYIGILVWFFSSVFLGEPKNGPKETEDTIENRILTQLLKNNEGKYINFVDNETSSWSINHLPYKIKMTLIDNMKEELGQDETLIQSVNMTFDKFIKINQQPVNLTIKSSIKDGYYIDYDEKISRYFEPGGGGWERLRLFRRCLGSCQEVTLPAYDPETGIVIVNIGFQRDWLAGSGGIYLFMYKNEQFHFIAYHNLWVS